MKDAHVSLASKSLASEHGRRRALTPSLGLGGARRRAGRWAALVSFTGLATAAALVSPASSASAIPTGCTTTNDSRTAQSRCVGGTGEHRVVMAQRHFDPNVGVVACLGPWVPVGAVSHVLCGVHEVVSVTVERR